MPPLSFSRVKNVSKLWLITLRFTVLKSGFRIKVGAGKGIEFHFDTKRDFLASFIFFLFLLSSLSSSPSLIHFAIFVPVMKSERERERRKMTRTDRKYKIHKMEADSDLWRRRRYSRPEWSRSNNVPLFKARKCVWNLSDEGGGWLDQREEGTCNKNGDCRMEKERKDDPHDEREERRPSMNIDPFQSSQETCYVMSKGKRRDCEKREREQKGNGKELLSERRKENEGGRERICINQERRKVWMKDHDLFRGSINIFFPFQSTFLSLSLFSFSSLSLFMFLFEIRNRTINRKGRIKKKEPTNKRLTYIFHEMNVLSLPFLRSIRDTLILFFSLSLPVFFLQIRRNNNETGWNTPLDSREKGC